MGTCKKLLKHAFGNGKSEQSSTQFSFRHSLIDFLCKIIGFGFILCFDSFLYTFTILPIRFVLALSRFVSNIFRRSPPPLPPSQKADLLRALLLVISLLILNPLTDASKIYHMIRGQDTIKLYVIFNALEVRRRISQVSLGIETHSVSILFIDWRSTLRFHWAGHFRLSVLAFYFRAFVSSNTYDNAYFSSNLILFFGLGL